MVGDSPDMMQRRLSAMQTEVPEGARPLRWWSTAQLDLLALRAQTLFDQWCGDWNLPVGRSEASPSIQVVPAHSDPVQIDQRWVALFASEGVHRAWWTVRPGPRSHAHLRPSPKGRDLSALELAGTAVQMALFGREANPAGQSDPLVASGVSSDAVEDWRLRLGHWLGAEDVGEASSLKGPLQAFSPFELTQLWSGAVLLTVDWFGDVFQLAMDYEQATRLIGPCVATTDGLATGRGSEIALTPVLSALSEESVSMTAELNPIELDLGTLTGLQIDDVIRIPHLLEMPLLVHADDGTLLYQAFLGRLEDQKAIELFPLTQTSPL